MESCHPHMLRAAPLLDPALLDRFRESEFFQSRSSDRALQHASAILGNSDGNRCSDCWMANGQCICNTVPQLPDCLSGGHLARVFLYTHHDEMHRRISTNTGKLLQLVLGQQQVRRVVLAQHAQELAMVRELAETLRRQKSLFPRSRCFVLFPSRCSSTLDKVLPCAGHPVEGSSSSWVPCRDGLTVVVLDGTWSDAKALNKRLDMLLSIYLRDVANQPLRSEDASACFPFRSPAERDLLLAKHPAERAADAGQRRSLGGEAAAPSDCEVAGATKRNDEWQRLLPRVKLSGGGSRIANATGPTLRKHRFNQVGGATGDDAATPAVGRGTAKTADSKERASTAGAFAMLLSELAVIAEVGCKAPADTSTPTSGRVLAHGTEDHDARHARLLGTSHSQGCVTSGGPDGASCRRFEGMLLAKETQEGTSGWQKVASALLASLDLQAEAFKRQMHGAK